jgi:hypothetical protein
MTSLILRHRTFATRVALTLGTLVAVAPALGLVVVALGRAILMSLPRIIAIHTPPSIPIVSKGVVVRPATLDDFYVALSALEGYNVPATATEVALAHRTYSVITIGVLAITAVAHIHKRKAVETLFPVVAVLTEPHLVVVIVSTTPALLAVGTLFVWIGVGRINIINRQLSVLVHQLSVLLFRFLLVQTATANPIIVYLRSIWVALPTDSPPAPIALFNIITEATLLMTLRTRVYLGTLVGAVLANLVGALVKGADECSHLFGGFSYGGETASIFFSVKGSSTQSTRRYISFVRAECSIW